MIGEENREYRSVRQAAKELGITRQGVDYLIRVGDITTEYVDNFYLIPRSEISRLQKEKTYKIIIVNNTQKVAELIYEAD